MPIIFIYASKFELWKYLSQLKKGSWILRPVILIYACNFQNLKGYTTSVKCIILVEFNFLPFYACKIQFMSIFHVFYRHNPSKFHTGYTCSSNTSYIVLY